MPRQRLKVYMFPVVSRMEGLEAVDHHSYIDDFLPSRIYDCSPLSLI